MCEIDVFCQAIEPLVGETLCRQFQVDNQVDLHAIALKSREEMSKRGLDPHELYKEADIARLVICGRRLTVNCRKNYIE